MSFIFFGNNKLFTSLEGHMSVNKTNMHIFFIVSYAKIKQSRIIYVLTLIKNLSGFHKHPNISVM